MKQIKHVAIAHRFPVVREGLKSILASDDSFIVSAEAGSLHELQNFLDRKTETDIVILDLLIPGGGGLEALKQFKTGYPKISILVLSYSQDDHIGLRAFKAGASGFISKESTSKEILSALRTVVSGKRSFSPEVEEMIFGEISRKAPADELPHHQLSDRELHVFILLGDGKTVTQISRDLSLSVKTVSTYRLRVLRKMKMTNNSEIIRYIVPLGLVRDKQKDS